jgi:hypothetical protein
MWEVTRCPHGCCWCVSNDCNVRLWYSRLRRQRGGVDGVLRMRLWRAPLRDVRVVVVFPLAFGLDNVLVLMLITDEVQE